MAGKVTAYTLTRALTAEDKLANQARQMLEAALNDHGVGTKITTEQFVASATPAIETRQPVGRVLAYYTAKMEEMGLVELERAAPEPKAEKPKKANKEKAAKASEEDVDGDAEDADGDDGSDD